MTWGVKFENFEKTKQAASCEGEGFKRVKLRKEGLKGLEKFEVGKVRNSKSLKLIKRHISVIEEYTVVNNLSFCDTYFLGTVQWK